MPFADSDQFDSKRIETFSCLRFNRLDSNAKKINKKYIVSGSASAGAYRNEDIDTLSDVTGAAFIAQIFISLPQGSK